MNIIHEVVDILERLYRHGWDERNGGNLSLIIDECEAMTISPTLEELKTFRYDFDLTPLVGKYLIITISGKYFKNAIKEPEKTLGLFKVKDTHTLSLIWGAEDNGRPTSEAPTHLKSHIARLSVDPAHRLVIHCHPTNVICMTHILPLESNLFTEILWKMQTESIVVFPEGVAVLPWILCGGEEIGIATAEKLLEYRSVIWSQHGIFCTGANLDEVFGLIETIEKAADIYVRIADKKIVQSISNENLITLANAFKVTYRKGIID